MRALLRSIAAAALGAAAMYYLDNNSGRRRRALLRDKLGSTGRRIVKRSRSQARRVAGSAYGMLHHAVSSAPTSDQQLTERVRARLGRTVRTPGAIDVTVDGHVACVGGHVLADEHDKVIREIRGVPGIERVDDRLCVHQQPGNVPELQGAVRH
ncbi:osmotically-inducible protein OsmY [Paraburkholderia terricola]|jgi:osmotically-inducible protein OsmY|uniref:BON domain-containing protein n=1 Tax=Paraburkholderia terricola TaxID=169427 RepID=UPI00285CD82F|nr:BON domain-containing protein [Paraburkholderia terricola]MDR6446569.1 osmotically-inducible protein OsmY [Paraburkholderia terricola]